MKKCKQKFLYIVGIISLAFDEFSKSYMEASKAVDEQRQRVQERVPKKNQNPG